MTVRCDEYTKYSFGSCAHVSNVTPLLSFIYTSKRYRNEPTFFKDISISFSLFEEAPRNTTFARGTHITRSRISVNVKCNICKIHGKSLTLMNVVVVIVVAKPSSCPRIPTRSHTPFLPPFPSIALSHATYDGIFTADVCIYEKIYTSILEKMNFVPKTINQSRRRHLKIATLLAISRTL